MAVELREYQNLSGKSDVASYATGDDFIVIEFKRRYRRSYVFYSYNHSQPGASAVESMKQLAEEGRGLNTYIAKNLRSEYSYYKRGNSLESVIDAV